MVILGFLVVLPTLLSDFLGHRLLAPTGHNFSEVPGCREVKCNLTGLSAVCHYVLI
jgi:hypothetical protein